MSSPPRRDVMVGGSLTAALPLVGSAGAAEPYNPSLSVSLSPAELAAYRDPSRLAHITAAQPLVNRARAEEIMDKHGLDALVASTPKNVYYLSSHDNAFYHTGIEHMLFAILPRRADAAPSLIMWGPLLYHLDYRPTWMPQVQVYTAPAALERGLALTAEEMRGDPPAMKYNRNLVRKGAELSERDKFQLALAAEYVDKTSASGLHALKRAIVGAGLAKGRVGFDDPRMIPWMADVGLGGLTGVDAGNIFREVRMVKSVHEVALLGEVSKRCERALDAAIASLHVGQTIADVEDQYRKTMGAEGGNTRWLIINQDGLNSGRIERDKVIKIDSVGDYKGYVGDIGRSIVVGTPTDETARRNEANQKALSAAYAAIRPGTPFAAAAKIVADVMAQEGYNGFGSPHAVGLDHTDMPYAAGNPLMKIEPPVFAENTVFTLDVPYLEVGYGSSHVEDMMVVTKSGAVPLSSGDVSLRVRPA
ncbi:MAG: M24 family metallopeptidase [Rhodospirillaceae bacterium]|nr:M24 family metallopeptidase [Rhodospirillaceae bacterium]